VLGDVVFGDPHRPYAKIGKRRGHALLEFGSEWPAIDLERRRVALYLFPAPRAE
jgi:hypothetical protein